jgi:hypothetical protein
MIDHGFKRPQTQASGMFSNFTISKQQTCYSVCIGELWPNRPNPTEFHMGGFRQ